MRIPEASQRGAALPGALQVAGAEQRRSEPEEKGQKQTNKNTKIQKIHTHTHKKRAGTGTRRALGEAALFSLRGGRKNPGPGRLPPAAGAPKAPLGSPGFSPSPPPGPSPPPPGAPLTARRRRGPGAAPALQRRLRGSGRDGADGPGPALARPRAAPPRGAAGTRPPSATGAGLGLRGAEKEPGRGFLGGARRNKGVGSRAGGSR